MTRSPRSPLCVAATPARIAPYALLACALVWAPPATAGKLADAIKAVPLGDAFDDEVRALLLSADADCSGALDTSAELSAVPCDAWQAVDLSVRAQWDGTGVRVIYGFEASFLWVGSALGVAESVRVAADDRLAACDIAGSTSSGTAGAAPGSTSVLTRDDRGAATSSGGGDGTLAGVITALPAPKRTEWAAAVRELLVGAYDLDGSGALDTTLEVASLDCATWKALDTAGAARTGGTDLRRAFGFEPDFLWTGGELGFGQGQRAAGRLAAAGCGVGPTPTDLSASLQALTDGGSDAWDRVVGLGLLAAHDADRSGLLDTPAEIRAVPCGVWKAVDDGVRQNWPGSFRQVYGVHPDPQLTWVASALGIDESQRVELDTLLASCGLLLGGTAPTAPDAAPAGATPAAQLAAIRPADDFDATARMVLTAAYDTDGDGLIAGKEAKAIPCDTWDALNAGVALRWNGTGVRIIYGFAKDYIWVGHAFGFVEKDRKRLDKAAAACGLE